MRARSVVVLAAFASIAACGGAPAAPPAAPATPSAFVVAAAPASAVDLSEVPPPPGLALTARLSRPGLALQLLPLPVPLTLDAAVENLIGAPVGRVADADAPIDLAVIHRDGGEDPLAFSVQLRDDPEVLRSFTEHFDLGPAANGARRLSPKDPSGATAVCALAPAPNTAAPRLVCAQDDDDLDTLLPYLTRTVTRAASASDLRAEMLLSPFVTNLDPDGDDPFDRAGAEMGARLLRDIRSVTLEGNLDGHDVDATLTLRFASATGDIVSSILGQAAPPGPPPPAFLRLPGDALLAFHAQGATPAALAPLRRTLGAGFRKSFIDDGEPADVVERFMVELERLFLTGGPVVWASGADMPAARAALTAYVRAGSSTPALRDAAKHALKSWVVVGVEEPSARWIEGIRTLVKLDQEHGKGPRSGGAGGKAATPASGKPAPPKPKKREIVKERSELRVTPMPPGLGLPAGTLHLEDRNKPNPAWIKANPGAPPPVPHTNHAFVVPDGGRTWLAVAEDPKLAASKARAVLAGAPATGTLGARRDAEIVRREATSAALLVTIAGLAIPMLSDGTHDDLVRAHAVMDALATITANGTAAVPLLMSVRREGQGGAATAKVRLPLATAMDASRALGLLF